MNKTKTVRQIVKETYDTAVLKGKCYFKDIPGCDWTGMDNFYIEARHYLTEPSDISEIVFSFNDGRLCMGLKSWSRRNYIDFIETLIEDFF